MPGETILEVRNLTKLYPGVRALDDVSLSFRKGEVHALLGENGAGKSTLIKMITGAIKPTSGSIIYKGKEYTELEPMQAKNLGIGVIYQEFNLFPALTVAENVMLFDTSAKKKISVDYKRLEEKTAEIGRSIGIELNPKKHVGDLPVGMQQIVEISRALAENVDLLIMDEPSAPLTNTEIDKMMEIIETLRKKGVTIIYISHRMEELFRISDRVSVFCDGRYIDTVNTAETNEDELVKLMVGRELKQVFPERTTPIGEEVLRVENLTGNGVEDINFTLHKGEILGFAGLLGSGRTETMQLVYGVKQPTAGQIFLNGKPIRMKNTTFALSQGVGMIPEDRKKHGGIMHMDLAWNVTLSSVTKISRATVVDRKKEFEIADEYQKKLKIKTPSMKQKLRNLSGGNQQKVVVAKMLATNADILIFDEPTRGIDVGAKQEMYALIRQLSDEGKSIIMVSSEMEEVLGLSDRIIVLSEGKISGELQREQFSQENVLRMASAQR